MVQRFRNPWLERFGDVRLSQFIDSVFPLSQASDAQRRIEMLTKYRSGESTASAKDASGAVSSAVN